MEEEYTFILEIKKSGNSYIVRIPREMKKLLSLKPGDFIKIKVVDLIKRTN